MNILKVLIPLLIFLILACTTHDELEPPDNPLDPNNPVYELPTSYLTSGPANGEVLNNTEVTFQWVGNESATEYSYKLDNSDWGEWTEELFVTFSYLDDGNHTFDLKASSVNGDVQIHPTEILFTVAAVSGPALITYPYYQEAYTGDTLTISIQLVEVDSIYGLGFELTIPTDSLTFVGYKDGELIEQWGGQTLSIVNVSAESSVSTLSFAITAVEGTPSGFSGSTSVLDLQFIASHEISILLLPQNVSLVNTKIHEIQLVTIRGGIINAF